LQQFNTVISLPTLQKWSVVDEQDSEHGDDDPQFTDDLQSLQPEMKILFYTGAPIYNTLQGQSFGDND
jgi:hypothetical protein